jgi:hypothetical protein
VRASFVLGISFVTAFGLDCGSTRIDVDTPTSLTAAIVAEPPAPSEPPSAPPELAAASRYLQLSSEACLAELLERGIDHARAPERAGIDTPVRILGPLSGVRFRTMVAAQERLRSLFEICDCRLALALDDFAKQLRARNIIEVLHYSAYRPIVPGVLPRAHEAGLAIDIAVFVRADKTSIQVVRDFEPLPLDRPCTQPPLKLRRDANELRRIACDAVESGLFHLALTPDYDKAHHDHFHLELIPGATTFVAR